MSNPTSNFGWQMPTATDLVTDLPADFEVFGQAVDTALMDLKGGTTGQVLAKNSATDMDFIWTAGGDITGVTAGTGISGGGTSGDVTITNSMATTITTNGDLIYGTGSGTFTRRGIGSTGDLLTVSGGVPVWSAPAAGGKVLQVVNTTYATAVSSASSSYSDTGLTATITPTSATSKILVFVSQNGVGKDTGNTGVNLRLLRDATTIVQLEIRAGHTGSTATNFVGGSSTTYLDSPATTSATTYKTQLASNSGGNAAYVQGDNQRSTITLMEIGA
jgi:hypothetical protein